MTSEEAIERAARDSYGRLLAWLSARSRDVAAAEDALSDAFHAALTHWPRSGVPGRPEAWLLTTARRRLLDRIRHARVEAAALPHLAEDASMLAESDTAFPDERLKLLFVCAHPAIAPAARTPLMLQVVLGLDAARIASAFLVQPAAMGQRLSRAKAKIRDAGISFEVPGPDELAPRLDAVLEAIYAAYGSGWDDVAGADPRRRGLATEAIELGRLVVQLLPDEPEAMGLLSLMLHCEARRDARRVSNTYVPLSEQDVSRWSHPMMAEAEHWLAAAARHGRMGRFQLEAAIQSAHASRIVTGRTDWNTIAVLYEGLVHLSPTIGAIVGRAAAVAEARGPEAGLALLQDIEAPDYQPWHALQAHLLGRLGRTAEAGAAYERAIGLCQDEAMRGFLRQREQRLQDSSIRLPHVGA